MGLLDLSQGGRWILGPISNWQLFLPNGTDLQLCAKGRPREKGHPRPQVSQQVSRKAPPKKNLPWRNLTSGHKKEIEHHGLGLSSWHLIPKCSSLDKQKYIFFRLACTLPLKEQSLHCAYGPWTLVRRVLTCCHALRHWFLVTRRFDHVTRLFNEVAIKESLVQFLGADSPYLTQHNYCIRRIFFNL